MSAVRVEVKRLTLDSVVAGDVAVLGYAQERFNALAVVAESFQELLSMVALHLHSNLIL